EMAKWRVTFADYCRIGQLVPWVPIACIIKGQGYKLTNLHVSANSHSQKVQLNSVLGLHDVHCHTDFAQSDPLKGLSPQTRKHFRKLDADQSLPNQTLLYTTRQTASNFTKMVSLIRVRKN